MRKNERLISVNELKSLREILEDNSKNEYLFVLVNVWLTIFESNNIGFFERDYSWLTLASDDEIIRFLDKHPEIPRDKKINGLIFGTDEDKILRKEQSRYFRRLKKRLDETNKRKIKEQQTEFIKLKYEKTKNKVLSKVLNR